MFTAVTKSSIISRLSCNLLNKTWTKRIVLQLNKPRSYVGGYVNHNAIRFLKRNRMLLKSTIKTFSSDTDLPHSTKYELTHVQYEKICNETLYSLTEYFEELVEAAVHLADADISYGDGVLTIKFGEPYGTYVINRQTPNKQIWLSSPKSGPKRYDFINGQWIYKHDGKTIHELLNNEIPAIIRNQTSFDKCSFSGRK